MSSMPSPPRTHNLQSPLPPLTRRLEILGRLLETADKTTLRPQVEEVTRSSFRLVGIIR